MIHISHRPVKPEVLERVFGLIFTTLGRRRNKSEFETVITALFSHTEKIMIGKRMAVYLLLTKNISWSDITDTLKVSTSLVSKCAMTLQNNVEYRRIVGDMAAHDAFVLGLEEIILQLLTEPGRPFSNWKAAWRNKKTIEERKSHGI